MNNKLKHTINKIRYHSYSIPILGYILRNTVGRRSRSHAVRSKIWVKFVAGDIDKAKIALTARALHYHPYKQVCRSVFTERVFNYGRTIGVLIEVPSRKALSKDKEA